MLDQPAEVSADHVDVLIVGAGLSGIGAACHLRRRCPDKTYAIVESRDYVRATARAYGVDRAIRFRHRVVRAHWSSDTALWTVEMRRPTDDSDTDTGDTVELTCSFLFCCSGYYRYDEGYTPRFEGIERYAGLVVHPQHWPEDLAYAGRRVVVIGSGATAVTLVPALARQAEHVTMVQRSPGYLAALPSRDRVADTIRHWLPARTAYSVVRWKNVLFSLFSFQLSRRRPETMKAWLRKGVVAQLPAGYDVDTHFTPRYNPWDQRLCLVPDADLFRAIRAGRVSVLTDRIETFTEQGLRMASGAEIAADIVVTATGLNLAAIGGMRLTVDGVEVDLAQTVAYKGMMLSGVPNFAMALGYTNASWTLKCDLVSAYVCRLLVHLDRHGYASCVPVRPELSPPDPTRPDATELTPLLDLSSGYIQRSVALLPRQGPRAPWRLYQNYPLDVLLMRHRSVADRGMRFHRPRQPVALDHST